MPYSVSSPTFFHRYKVFSTRKVTMHVSEKIEEQPKKYWLVESDAQSRLNIRPLDEDTWLPTGQPTPISVRDLQKRYSPEPGLWEEKVQPSLERFSAGKPMLNVPVPRDEGLPDPVDEAEVTKEFDHGLDLLNDSKPVQAKKVFASILNSGKPFEEKHKHLFNDFAIKLRKNNLYDEAVSFYSRAIELSWGNEDENLHINLARALYAEKQFAGCVQHLFEALRISPKNKVAISFLIWLDQQKVIPKQYALQVKGYLTQHGSSKEYNSLDTEK